ncbi:hypothetical protein QNZ70_004536 [Vibrio parahaemolyticus]|nr:hypothetical protein [Vibrio parahaemolyticus]
MANDYDTNRNEIDTLADQALENLEPPHPLLDISVWHLLTTAEDQIRMFFAGWIPNKQLHLLSIVDNLKYALRHSISDVSKKTKNEKITLPQKTIPKAYEQASKLLIASEKYETLSRLIASTYNSRGKFIKSGEDYELEYSDLVDIRYSVLEGLGHGADVSPDITGVLHRWLTIESKNYEEQLIATKIFESVRVKKGRVAYKYNEHVAYGIAKQIPQRDEVIPDDFVFSWGAAYKTHALINSLLVRCLYHVLAVEFAARKLSLKGGAESSLLLVISKEQLCTDLQQLANFSDQDVCAFIDMLTYGNNALTPDIALQPLFLSKSGLLMIPCYHILNSNVQRNLLALLAKISPKKFDTQSSCFENHMVSKIQPSLKNWNQTVLNKEFKVRGQKEEIDGLILDKQNKTILLLELRWILQPGDAREVYNKIKVTSEKVDQLSRKINFVKKNFSEIVSRAFGESIDVSKENDWCVKGVVVVQGFGGTVSHDEDIPVVTMDILCKGLRKFNKLDSLYLWIKQLSWLPVQGIHFDVENVIEDNELVKVSRLAARTLVNQLEFTSSLQKNIAENSTT